MNWLKNLLGSNGHSDGIAAEQPKSKTYVNGMLATQPAPDLVDGINALAAYYRYLEADAYDGSLKSARDRRDFRDELLKRIDALLAYEHDATACDQVQYEINKEADAFAAPASAARTDAASEARSRDPKGYALLALSGPLTFDSLRTAYRDAAKKHHPDVGGDNATMQQVNDAYALFSAILRRSAAQNDVATSAVQVSSQSVDRFFRNVHLKQFDVSLDDLAADRAWTSYQVVNLTDIEQAFRGVDLVARLAKLMAAWGRADDAQRVLHDLEILTKRGQERGLNYAPIYRQTVEQCKDAKRIRFVPNHGRQADNLLRLGIIDQKRYSATIERINATEAELSSGESAFAQFVQGYTFLRLPMDPAVNDTPITSLVPAPGYYARVETLTRSQACEYAQAFHGGAAHLALKYLAIRLDALLRAPFSGYRNIEAVVSELKAISNVPGLNRSMQWLCSEALTVTSFLQGLPPSDRDKRIALLKRLDGLPGQYEIVISTSGDLSPMSRPIFLNQEYTKFATGSIERIERYIATGSEVSENERDEERKRWQESHAFRESPIYKRAQKATWAKEKDSEEIAAAVGALCEAMYDRAAQGDLTMEIGYWTNDLTIHLVKLKRFAEAFRWIERLETAPEAIKRRTPGSIVTSLEKRRTRCVSALDSRSP